MKHLLIANKGTLEVEALTLLGASSKRGDKSKIGKFGSGNKYALAYFLRAGVKVRIFSGNEEIILGLVRKNFREHPFDVITVNGQETSITTEFGHEWSVWQAIRELYSNAVDEGLLHFGFLPDTGLFLTDDIDTTRIYIEATKEIEDFMFNVRDYFAIGNEILFECPAGKIYRKHNSTACIYYRGIKCFETKDESIFDYDLNNVELDENRLIKYNWTLPEEMWKILFACNNPVIIRTLLNEIQRDKKVENLIDTSWVSLTEKIDKEAWAESIKGNSIVPKNLGGYVKDSDIAKTLFLPTRLYGALIGLLGDDFRNKEFTVTSRGALYHKVEPDILAGEILFDIDKFFKECGFKIPYEMIIVDFDNKEVMGSVTDDNEILISAQAFTQGKQFVTKVMIEEYIHIKHGVADETRAFQNAIIDEFISYMKLKNAYSL